MRGRQIFTQSLSLHGADKVFGNPGTTENPLLEELADHSQIEYITTLHESVAVCAAGLYAQASGKTAVANVHVAPGLGNAIGMMYGALKSQVPVVVTAGQQDTRLRLREPLLRHDLVAMAAPVCKWAAEPQTADEMAPIMARAFQIANTHPKGPVFVALPNNVMEQETEIAAFRHAPEVLAAAEASSVAQLADRIVQAERIAVCPGDHVATYNASDALAALLKLTGADVLIDFIPARQAISAQHPQYAGTFAANASANQAMLAPYDLVIAVGGVTMEEIWFDPAVPVSPGTTFAQIELTSTLLGRTAPPDIALVGDLTATLQALTDEIQNRADATFAARVKAHKERLQQASKQRQAERQARQDKLSGRDPLAPIEALSVLAEHLPQDVVIVDEAITASVDLDQAFAITDPDGFFGSRGGGIGQGLAGAIGVAAAKPDALIVAVSGDGSAMYSIQALWTAARHNLRILFVILANAEYRVLKHNMDIHRQRFDAPTDQPYPFMDLDRPSLEFVEMARGMGVDGRRARTAEEIGQAISEFNRGRGPYLLELVVAGKST
ncbi:MAG: thiamine pyrophosphate-binding protein [Pseudomonadales bacterium]